MNENQAGPRPAPELIAEATKRAGLIWIEIAGQDRPCPAWHVWAPGAGEAGRAAGGTAGAAYVLTGPGEQSVPGLAEADRATVIVASRESGGRIASWRARVSRILPADPDWDAVIGPLLAGRLNEAPAPEGEPPARRWARECAVFRLEPAG